MFNRPSLYRIDLNRPNGVYVAGEDVVGTLHLHTNNAITCRGVRLKLMGKGYVHWHVGSGDNRNDYRGRKTYLDKSITVSGNFYRTTTLDGCGANAIFDPNTGGGEMVIPLDDGKVDENFVLAVRSMDSDWGKKDDLLGETLVRVWQDLLQNPNVPVSFPLRRNGQIHKGEVTLSAYVRDLLGKSVLQLNCHKSTGLASADFFGKNDVYVQCYRVPSETDEGAALPLPQKNHILPAGTKIAMPFSIKLPLKYIPSSFSTWHGDACYVSYSIYSNIDIKWNLDPSVRRYITVLSSELPSPVLLAPVMRTEAEPQTIYGCDLCGLACCEKGDAFFRAAIDKTYLGIGDALYITAFAKNNTEDACAFTVTLNQRFTMQASNRSRAGALEHTLVSDHVPAGGTLDWPATNPKMVIIPQVPPTFHKGIARSEQGHWNTRDPLHWFYILTIKLDMPGFFTTDIVWNIPVSVGAFPVNSLLAMAPQRYGVVQQHVVDAGIGDNDLPPPFDDVSYPPPTFEPDFVGSAVPIQDSRLRGAADDMNEDKNNFGGPPAPFAPAYPAPAQRCAVNANLPNVSGAS